ncbi:MAG: prolyl oligopeptidase family serine peptidase [Rubripirellula sp.]
MNIKSSLLLLSLISLPPIQTLSYADGPADNLAAQVRPIPPVGDAISKEIADTLAWRCKAIRAQWGTLLEEARVQDAKSKKPSTQAVDRVESLASEVLVFPRAVEMAIEFSQFYKPRDPQIASQLLDEANRRLELIRGGGSWPEVVGLSGGSGQQLIVGGYTSKIDGSFQPYGLVVPSGLTPGDSRPRRLDLWFHGRGETLSEVAFLSKQQVDAGQYTPSDTFVLHPYGRYSNAFKFAGEVDVLEALEHVQSHLPVDPDRISVRGFSMGGAACWQLATHYADRWFAANPGAGFSETPEFLRFFQNEPVSESASDFEKTLWQLYDCPPWAINLSNCPTVAYSGEIDRQKQAADVMEATLEELNVDMLHVIGPNTAHKIHPDSKLEIEARMSALARHATGAAPRNVEFATVTLRYHRMHWLDVRGLEQHWKPSRVSAVIRGDNVIEAETANVSRLRFDFASGQWPGSASGGVEVLIDGNKLSGPPVRSDRSWTWELAKEGGVWKVAGDAEGLLKRPELQGPIDDAFMDSFLFVLPSGKSKDAAVQKWVEAESHHAMREWRRHFRGDVRSKLDTELTKEDIRSANIVCFGDGDSNAVIARVMKSLPVSWTSESIAIGNAKTSAAGHVPILVYPNPLNANRYIVLNSGFTFREYDYLNNARQTPKLPDWALVDIREGATTRFPGIIRHAGFFNESWQPAD